MLTHAIKCLRFLNSFTGYLTDVSSGCTFKFNCVDPQTVFDMLHSISTSKATGFDQIPGQILKLAGPAITQSITMLFNYSIVTESFPSEWKIAKVIPLHKSGPRNLLDNYRPISILPAITKGHVTRCNFSCNLQCNSTLERCKIAKYESSLYSDR